jgi:HAE1 family hydrophobic/amphiphilic exporter-1
MTLTRATIVRPLTTIMLTLAVGLFGVLSYLRLPVGLLPNVAFPTIVVTTTYPGAPATVVESEITKRVEDAIYATPKLSSVQSTSSNNVSLVIASFSLDADRDKSAEELSKRLNAIRGELPSGAQASSVTAFDFNSLPVVQYAFSSDNLDLLASTLREEVVPKFERVEGAGTVTLTGVPSREVRITLKKDELQKRGITLTQIQSFFSGTGTLPLGALESGESTASVLLRAEYDSLDAIRALQLPGVGATTTLGDIATVALQDEPATSFFRVNGQPAVGVSVIKRGDASSVQVADGLNKVLEKAKLSDKGINTKVLTNDAESTRSSVNGGIEALAEGIILTSLILLIFLRSPRAALTVLISIPTSLLVTFIAMNLFGFSLNILSLLAVSLAIGILVDDSIVVIENIFKKLRSIKDSKVAAEEGRVEIGGAAIAITLVDVVVFLPIAVVGGIIGQFFVEFAVTLTVATLTSLLVSFTLTPMLSAYLVRPEKRVRLLVYLDCFIVLFTPLSLIGAIVGKLVLDNLFRGLLFGTIAAAVGAVVFYFFRPERTVFAEDDQGETRFLLGAERGVERLTNWYVRVLTWVLGHRAIVTVLVVAALLGSFVIPATGKIGLQFIPASDTGTASLEYILPEGVTVAAASTAAGKVEDFLAEEPSLEAYTISASDQVAQGGNAANVVTMLLDFGEPTKRSAKTTDLADALRARLEEKFPGAKFREGQSGFGGGGTGGVTGDLTYSVSGPDGAVVQEIATSFTEKLAGLSFTKDVTNSLGEQRSDVVIEPKPELYRAGLQPYALAGLLQGSLGTVRAGTYLDGEETVKVQLGLDKVLTTVDELNSFPAVQVPGRPATLLSDLATVNRELSFPSLARTDRLRTVAVAANLDGVALGNALPDVNKAIGELSIPDGYTVKATGSSEDFATAAGGFGTAILVSILLVYMILVALYESFKAPFVIMFSIPSALIGAFLALWLFKQPLDLLSAVGFIVLLGLVAKNGILLVDFGKRAVEEGMDPKEAMLQAGRLRFRPIIMTTFALIAGSLPLVFGAVDGAEFRQGIATVFIGGLTSSLILTLIFVPVVFSVVMGKRTPRRKKRA